MKRGNNKNNENKQQMSIQQNLIKDVEQFFGAETVETMMEKDLYFMEFNIGARPRNDLFIPVEVGIVKYSLKDGVKDSFHDFIDPGSAPMGYRASINDATEEHGIPFDTYTHPNYNKLCEFMYMNKTSRNDEDEYLVSLQDAITRIDRFVQPEKVLREAGGGRPQGLVRPIFSAGFVQTEGCLNRLAEETKNSLFAEGFEVLDIARMAKFACKLVKVDQPFATYKNAFSTLVIGYPYELLCQFHLDVDNRHCAISQALTSAQSFTEQVAVHYPVPKTPKQPEPTPEPTPEEEVVWLPTRFGW